MTMQFLDPSQPPTPGSSGTVDLGPIVFRSAGVFVVPRSQHYYWSEAWQAGERETLTAYEHGEGVRFASGRALSRWLLDRNGEGDDQGNGD